ncbi:MAG: pectate lyase-like adhesive domain-containing protein [Synergistales bacterium]|nr:pectate lyase-like adhesive domain-containing protein [Synergistales bacterium]MDY6400926.1 pectate lyase-like adhesive domain-containing protein [Synergistales bacterium]MDY6405368.1 pectate lyase-like adhesive domain-containing protein [Synergistales bacterium]MDY6410704.1 pectate lyase-like adhesive domain-containing protein [Synergistales bacterium]MDY6413733.1 pectate lyase-like adhesive domain-containing protein [Synergistales bacterium]
MKRIKWLMLLCAFAVMFAVPAWAADKTMEVTDSADLIAAVASKDVTVIKLSNDITLTSKDGTIEISRDVSIDLNSHDIIATNVRALWIKSGDVTIYGEGVISATSKDKGDSGFKGNSSVIRVGNKDNTAVSKTRAKLTIEKDVTVSSDFCYGVSVFGSNDIDSSKDTADIEFVLNGTVSVTHARNNTGDDVPDAAVSANGTSGLSATKMTINGKVYSKNTYAIYQPGKGTLIVNGTVEGWGGIEAKGATTTVGDTAKIISTADKLFFRDNDNGPSTWGFAIAGIKDDNTGYPGNVKINIGSGAAVAGYVVALSEDTAEASVSKDVIIASLDAGTATLSYDTYPGAISITGGVFSKKPFTSSDKNVSYVSGDYSIIPLSDNTYKYGVIASVTIESPTLSIEVNGEDSRDYKAVYSADKELVLTALPTPAEIASVDIAYTYKWTMSGDATVSADTKAFVLKGLSTDSGTYKCVVTLSLDDKVLSAEATVKITITETVEESNKGTDSTSETITLTASSTDVTVYQGGSIDITVTATSGDNIVWSNSGTLPSGDFTVTSASKAYTITGTVATSATAGAYTYKVIASNDTNLTSVDIKITVKAAEKETETATTYTPSVTVSPDKLSLDKGATSGNTLTATMTISPDTTFTPSYQWYSNTTASTSGGTAISSATSATYTVPTDTTGTFYYFVIAATTLSDASITAASNIVTVTITGGGDTTPDYANMSADEVANLAVDEDGTISQDVVDAILETLTSSDGAVSVSDVANSEQLVAIYAASAKAKSGVLSLNTLPLDSLSGIGTLLSSIATANNTTTSTMTLDLAGQSSSLTKVDGLSGVSLKALTLKNNTHVETVDLSGATIPTVTLEGSAVEELTLGKTANVQKVEASGLSTLTSIDIEGNPYIEDLNINQTSISMLNAAGCTSLDNVAASGGSTPGGGSLEELDITSCDNLTQLDVENNKLLGVKKPSPRFAKPGFRFNAGGQRRPAPSGFALARSMNFWSILRSLLGLGTSGTIPFTVTTTTVTFTNGGTLDDSTGVVTYTSTPTVFSYYYNPGFTTADTSAFTTAADGSSMDVTIGSASSSTDSGEVTLGSSGGGCDAGFGLGALSAVMLMFALKKKRS